MFYIDLVFSINEGVLKRLTGGKHSDSAGPAEHEL